MQEIQLTKLNNPPICEATKIPLEGSSILAAIRKAIKNLFETISLRYEKWAESPQLTRALIKWQKEAPSTKEKELRKSASILIRKAFNENAEELDLSYMKITSLPDLSPLRHLKRLNLYQTLVFEETNLRNFTILRGF